MMNKCYIIVTEHVPSGVVNISSEGYDSLEKAQKFLIEERNCELYDKYFGDGKLGHKVENGWVGVQKRPKYEEDFRTLFPINVYTIKEIDVV